MKESNQPIRIKASWVARHGYDARMLKEQREVIRDYSSQEWRGAAKLEALAMSKKAMRSKPGFGRALLWYVFFILWFL
jgi:hypothetical protein